MKKWKRAALLAWAGGGTTILPTSLLAEWRFDDGAGTTLKDYSGNGYDGALGGGANAPTWGGGGLTFDANDYVNLYSAALAAAFSGQEITVEIVVKVASVDNWNAATQRVAFMFQVDASNLISIRQPATANTLDFRYVGGGTSDIVQLASQSWTDIRYLAITVSNAADQLKAYVSGAQVGSTQTGIGDFAGSLATTTVAAGAASTSGAVAWNGTLYYMILRSAALSAADISTNYSRVKTILSGRGVTVV